MVVIQTVPTQLPHLLMVLPLTVPHHLPTVLPPPPMVLPPPPMVPHPPPMGLLPTNHLTMDNKE